jgi:hypothetical protein
LEQHGTSMFYKQDDTDPAKRWFDTDTVGHDYSPTLRAAIDAAMGLPAQGKHSTRITYLVNHHLQYSIETAMKKALANANSSIVQGIEGAVKIALANATAALQVTVKTK